MEIEEAITKHLQTSPGLVPLIGNRVYQHGAVPENVVHPYVSILFIYGEDEQCLSENPDFAEDTFQFSSAGSSRTESIAVAKQVSLALKGFNGIMGGGGGINVQSVSQDGRKDSIERDSDGKTIFYRDEDFIFMYDKQ